LLNRSIINFIFLTATTAQASRIHTQFLNVGFLLPPAPSLPLILPGEFSGGEKAKLAAVLSEL
jgi:hypothetical protein